MTTRKKKSKDSGLTENNKYNEDTSFIVQKNSEYLNDLTRKENNNVSVGKTRSSK
jgi:hypothetical protein